MKIRRSRILIYMIVTMMSLVGCSSSGTGNNGAKQSGAAETGALTDSGTEIGTGVVLARPGVYDSADTAVVVSKNNDDNTVTFLNLEIGRKYTLTVDGATLLYDKYERATSLEQIKSGDIVDITFLKSKKRLNSVMLSPKAWSFESVESYSINPSRQDMVIGKSTYKITKDTLLFSEGKQIELMDLNAADVLTVKGIGTSILSIHVERGHGYLRLANDENFVGGWIEVGQSSIQKITEDMLLTVPEGRYQILISHNGGGGKKDVIINRNEEVTLDIGDLEVVKEQYGTVLFTLKPSFATVYVDGNLTDTSLPVSLEYGIHQLYVKADGYQSVTSYIKVGEEYSGLEVTLDKVVDDDEDDDSDDDGSDDDSKDDSKDDSTTATSYYKVYIDAPEGAEVYLNGNYVGISPCSFKKVSGSQIITLRMNGYDTRSYTIQVDEEEKDISYSFADLVKTGTASTAGTESTKSTADTEGTTDTEGTSDAASTKATE